MRILCSAVICATTLVGCAGAPASGSQASGPAITAAAEQSPEVIAEEAFLIGMNHLHGAPGFLRDPYRAFANFGVAARLGHAKAQYHLGLMYATGAVDLPDRPRAFMWFKSSYVNGYAEAQSPMWALMDVMSEEENAVAGYIFEVCFLSNFVDCD